MMNLLQQRTSKYLEVQNMVITKCPRCGTGLIKEEIEIPNPTDGSGSMRAQLLPSNCCEGSISVDVAPLRRESYVYRCPNCGYLTIQSD